MTILLLSKERRARVWFDGSPENAVRMVGATQFCRRIGPTSDSKYVGRSVTVELFVPLGGRFVYGLLGCEATGENNSTVDVIAQTASGSGLQFNDSLAGELDFVRWGLAEEYAKSVLDGATRAASLFSAPPVNTIQFSIAAHGEIGSTESIFERLSIAAIGLLTFPIRTDDAISNRLEEILSC